MHQYSREETADVARDDVHSPAYRCHIQVVDTDTMHMQHILIQTDTYNRHIEADLDSFPLISLQTDIRKG